MTTDDIQNAAVFALNFAAEKQALSLHTYDVEAIARTCVTHILNAAKTSGTVVATTEHSAELEKLKQRANQFERSWANEITQRDQQLQKTQLALSALPDRTLAKNLAAQIGVMLLEEAGGT